MRAESLQGCGPSDHESHGTCLVQPFHCRVPTDAGSSIQRCRQVDGGHEPVAYAEQDSKRGETACDGKTATVRRDSAVHEENKRERPFSRYEHLREAAGKD